MRIRSRSPSIDRKRRDLTVKAESPSGSDGSDSVVASATQSPGKSVKIELPKRQIKTNVGTDKHGHQQDHRETLQTPEHSKGAPEHVTPSEDVSPVTEAVDDRGRSRTKSRIQSSEIPKSDMISLMGFNALAGDKLKEADSLRQASVRHRQLPKEQSD